MGPNFISADYLFIGSVGDPPNQYLQTVRKTRMDLIFKTKYYISEKKDFQTNDMIKTQIGILKIMKKYIFENSYF